MDVSIGASIVWFYASHSSPRGKLIVNSILEILSIIIIEFEKRRINRDVNLEWFSNIFNSRKTKMFIIIIDRYQTIKSFC